MNKHSRCADCYKTHLPEAHTVIDEVSEYNPDNLPELPEPIKGKMEFQTTQSDNTLEGILKKFAIDTHEVRPGQDETLNFDNAKAALTKWRDDAVQTAQLDLLTRLEAQKEDLFWWTGGEYEKTTGVDMRAFQSERALIEKRMM